MSLTCPGVSTPCRTALTCPSRYSTLACPPVLLVPLLKTLSLLLDGCRPQPHSYHVPSVRDPLFGPYTLRMWPALLSAATIFSDAFFALDTIGHCPPPGNCVPVEALHCHRSSLPSGTPGVPGPPPVPSVIDMKLFSA